MEQKILKLLGVKGTFNLNSRALRAGSAFTDEMIREHILDKGIVPLSVRGDVPALEVRIT